MTIDVRFVTQAELPPLDTDTPRLVAEMQATGARVDVASWRDPDVDWSAARLTMIRSPWDYIEVVDEFVAWAYATALVSDLWNPAPLIEWNVHKSYLLDLQAQGAPVVPTVVLLQGAAASLDGISDAQGWNTVVVKPAVSSGAQGAGRFDVGDPEGQAHLDALVAAGDSLVQPFVGSVARDGEISVVVIDGAATHAIEKRPAAGDYRVQEHLGGTSVPVEAGPALFELAERV